MENFYIVLIGLWIYPIIGFILFKVTRKKPVTRKYIFISLLTLFTITALGVFFKFSTTSTVINWLLLSLTYLTVSIFLWYAGFHKNRYIKFAGIVFLVIILSTGYFLSSIGILGLAFIVGDYDVVDTQKLEKGIVCKESKYGYTISDTYGAWIKVYKTLTWFPIIEWQIAEKQYKNEIIPKFKASYSDEKKEIYLFSSEWNKFENKQEIWTDTISLK